MYFLIFDLRIKNHYLRESLNNRKLLNYFFDSIPNFLSNSITLDGDIFMSLKIFSAIHGNNF